MKRAPRPILRGLALAAAAFGLASALHVPDSEVDSFTARLDVLAGEDVPCDAVCDAVERPEAAAAYRDVMTRFCKQMGRAGQHCARGMQSGVLQRGETAEQGERRDGWMDGWMRGWEREDGVRGWGCGCRSLTRG